MLRVESTPGSAETGRWRSSLPDEGQASNAHLWLKKRCCAIWCDHFRQRRGGRAEDHESPLALANSKDQTTSLEWSRRMAPLKPCGGRHMHAACWLLAHISISCSNRSALNQDALVCAGIPTGMARFFSWHACASPPYRPRVWTRPPRTALSP